MSHWTFVLWAYLVTVVVIALEILVVRARHRAARAAAQPRAEEGR